MRLKCEEVLNQDIQNPPTEEVLAAMARQQRVVSRFVIGYWVMAGAVFFVSLATENPLLFGTFLLALVSGVTILFVHESASYYEPIPKHACEDAFEWFSATDVGVKYLHKLREQGRQVTPFDVWAARFWTEKAEEQEVAEKQSARQESACKKLYGFDA